MLNRPRHCQQGRGSKRAERSGRGLLASHTLPLPPNVIRRRRTPFGAPPSVLGQPWESNRLRHDCRDAPGRAARLRTRAIAVDNGASADDGKSGLGEVLLLGALFASWYMANIVFNIYNKEVLKVFPLPLTCTTAQFLIGSALALSAWVTGAVRKPEVTPSLLLRLVPLALVHTLGNLLTNVSLGAVAVSFTHTIKALEPIFSVALCSVFLGDRPHPLVLLTLLPIMGGVALASVAEATFNWPGFLAAMGSNLTFQSRNVLSKKLMIKKKKAPVVGPNGVPAAGGSGGSAGLDNINLFSIITCMSALLLLPGVADPNRLWSKLAMAGLCFHAYQQVSYMILSRVSPVTHSVGNCVKRVIVIVASVIVFQNPVSTQSLIGTSVALAGVFAYSQAKRATNPACEVVPPKAA